MKTYHYIDFEFRPSPGRNDLVCCCILTDFSGMAPQKKSEFWLNKDDGSPRLLKAFLRQYECKPNVYFVAFAAMAEISCFFDLGVDPANFNWICLRTIALPYVYSSSSWGYNFTSEWQSIDSYGNLVEEDLKSTGNLVNYMDYFCNIKRDLVEKKDMIRLIVDSKTYTPEQHRSILDYCWEDVLDLPNLHKSIINKGYYLDDIISTTSNTLVNYALMQRQGIPFNKDIVDAFVEVGPRIRTDLILECNKMFRDSKYDVPYVYNKKTDSFSENTKNFESFLEMSRLLDGWPRTENNSVKMDRDTTRAYASNPYINMFRTTKQMLSDIRAVTVKSKKEKHFFSYLSTNGDDMRQHPYYNPFGSVTGRCQPPATGFIYAQNSWMRVFMMPPKGNAIISMDFTSQEVWIAAALSGDLNLMDDYNSGDVYLSFGKSSGLIPWDGTKHTHAKERDICKGVILGLQFGMGIALLAKQTGVDASVAKVYVERHKQRYWKFWSWRKSFISRHGLQGRTELKNGWYLMDNRSHKDTEHIKIGEHYALTTGNFPIQGYGAVLLYEIVQSLNNRFYNPDAKTNYIMSTVHDEINMLVPDNDADINNMKEAMEAAVMRACHKYFPLSDPCRVAFEVQRDGELCIKPKGKKALERLSKYVNIPELNKIFT